MSKLIYADHKYKILKNYSGYVLINKKGDYMTEADKRLNKVENCVEKHQDKIT